ncbi:30S ribosomal protein S12 methylthiotransferase RimO [Granulicoccus phenolivorans]|uniref:30S ribosomal protein S12 methylthiotransferase RimO n=1 Tax=Granulicoccus phenolivorans TaxID=266854 RepID=UPI0004134FCA|nr:30S ribosomal protein S12 methylthiotransferase RimO [Granulicoccus phenolivorans]
MTPQQITDTKPGPAADSLTAVHLVTLGCARNEVDSEELAGRLADGGFRLVEQPEDADAVVVNTCGFIEAAKADSINTLLSAADLKETGKARAVVAVGCLAERYGSELAESLTETDAVLGFDSYVDIASKLQGILHGERPAAHTPGDRRKLLPLSPVQRQGSGLILPGHADTIRKRLDSGPYAPLKLASGCDRRCAFCAIPTFRGSYLSRRPSEILDEARWLVSQGVKELFLVSENSSSYGKDLGDIRLLETLLTEMNQIDGLEWIRVSYLQPAEIRPGLIETMVELDKVVPYFDLSFQHASGSVLRRMRRFGDAEQFLGLLEQIRNLSPRAGVRSNFIVGFPGETDQDRQILRDFLTEARLDAVGIFGYSDEEGTEAVRLPDHLTEEEIEEHRADLADLVEQLLSQRAEERLGEQVRVLIEEIDDDGVITGRAEHQGPEVDGSCEVVGGATVREGDIIDAVVTGAFGVDLEVEQVR